MFRYGAPTETRTRMLSALASKTSVSTNSTIGALFWWRILGSNQSYHKMEDLQSPATPLRRILQESEIYCARIFRFAIIIAKGLGGTLCISQKVKFGGQAGLEPASPVLPNSV